jgi:AcrR family transcriptional regulator
LECPAQPIDGSYGTGVKRAVQHRSQVSRNKLLEAGMEVLCLPGADEMSIVALCSKCGYSVGTFYRRFDHSGAFINTLQEYANEDVLTLINGAFIDENWKTAHSAVLPLRDAWLFLDFSPILGLKPIVNLPLSQWARTPG